MRQFLTIEVERNPLNELNENFVRITEKMIEDRAHVLRFQYLTQSVLNYLLKKNPQKNSQLVNDGLVIAQTVAMASKLVEQASAF